MPFVQAAQDGMRLLISASASASSCCCFCCFPGFLDEDDPQREQLSRRIAENAIIHILYTNLEPVAHLLPDKPFPRRTARSIGRGYSRRRAPIAPSTD